MTEITRTPLTGQPANAGNEWATALEDAVKQSLVDTQSAAVARANIAMGITSADSFADVVRALLAAGPAARMALDAVAQAYDPSDVIELRAVNPEGGGGPSLSGRLSNPNERAALEGFIRDHNGRSNVYVGINPRRADLAGTAQAASAQDIVARRAVVLDLDGKDAPPTDPNWTQTVADLRANLDPLLIVDSGNGVHVWLGTEDLSRADVSAATAPLAAAMARLGSDNMSDPPRIIRLPFTVNLPNAAKRARGATVRLAAPLPDFTPFPRVLLSAPPSVTALCGALEETAKRLGLPGRGNAVAGPSAQIPASGSGEPKTGWAAPSADLLRLALQELPNTPGAAFDDRAEWLHVAMAVKGAAVAGGFETEGREAFVSWSQQWGGDQEEPGRVWESIVDPHVGWGTLMRTLEAVDPAAHARVKTASVSAAFDIQVAQTRADILGAPFAPVAPILSGQIPPRRWLYGRTAIAGFLAFLVAPGGAGKSSLAMVEAVAMASGKELLAGERPVRPLRVWVHNAEDDLLEMQRRLAATLQHFGMTNADLNGNLFMTSGRDMKLQFARMGRNAPEIVPGVVDALVERARLEKLDVIFLDPLGALHTLPENSNEAANMLSGALREIAHRADVAVIVLHHTGKAAATDMDAAGAGASRGASAFVDAARVVRQVVRMTEKEATDFGIAKADRRDYLRVENGKANLARAEGGRWLRMVDVALQNGMGLWPHGDRVGVSERWSPPTLQPGTASDLALVQNAIGTATTPPRADIRSGEWAGYLIAQTLGLNVGPSKAADKTAEEAAAYARVRGMLDTWLRDRCLILRDWHDPKTRKDVKVIGIGTPAVVLETDEETKSGGEA